MTDMAQLKLVKLSLQHQVSRSQIIDYAKRWVQKCVSEPHAEPQGAIPNAGLMIFISKFMDMYEPEEQPPNWSELRKSVQKKVERGVSRAEIPQTMVENDGMIDLILPELDDLDEYGNDNAAPATPSNALPQPVGASAAHQVNASPRCVQYIVWLCFVY
ncbi:g6728 [Coccomyxa elongata]